MYPSVPIQSNRTDTHITHIRVTLERTEAEAVGGVREQAQLHHLQLQPALGVGFWGVSVGFGGRQSGSKQGGFSGTVG